MVEPRGTDPWAELAEHYDTWVQGESDDVAFYVEEARRSGGPVAELGVGTGRVAVPTARAGIRVIGIDLSEHMLAICRERVEREGLADLVDLRIGDFRTPPVTERLPLVTCPFRSMMHLGSDADRRQAIASAAALLLPGGRFVFDVFTPTEADADDPRFDWHERAPGIWERDELDLEERRLRVSLRAGDTTTDLQLHWVERGEWRELLEAAGLEVVACYGWFDRRPCAAASAHSVWIAESR